MVAMRGGRAGEIARAVQAAAEEWAAGEALRRSERHHGVLAVLGKRALGAESSLAFAGEAAHRLCFALDAERVRVIVFEADGAARVAHSVDGAPLDDDDDHDADQSGEITRPLEPQEISVSIPTSRGPVGTLAVRLAPPRTVAPAEADFLASAASVVGLVAERERLAQELVLARTHDGFGALARTAAHDLNNVLAVIGTSLSAIDEDRGEAPPAAEDLDLIRKAVERGRAVSASLLAWGHKAPDPADTRGEAAARNADG
jgi:hypothetical protein